jgi:hypothetical protein
VLPLQEEANLVYAHLHGSVHGSVRAVRAVCVAVCGSALGSGWQCGSVCVWQYAAVNMRQCGSLWQCGRLCEAVHAAVCGSARGSVWQCTWQSVTVRLVVYESVCSSAAGRMCVVVGSVKLCGSVWQCAQLCAAVCGSACGIVWWQQCALRIHKHKVADNIYFILLYPL